MARLTRRAEANARARQRSTIGRLAENLRALGIHVEAGADQIVVSGRGLGRRWLVDPALRFLGRLR